MDQRIHVFSDHEVQIVRAKGCSNGCGFGDGVGFYPEVALTPHERPSLIGRKTEDHRAFARRSRLQRIRTYVINNSVFIAFLLVYTVVNIIMFIARAIQYREACVFEMLARASGCCLNLNCTLVLVLMLRRCITWLRCHGASNILPLDNHVFLHKLIGWITFVLSLVHTVMHLANLALLSEEGQFTYLEYLFSTKPGIGWLYGAANSTGIALLVILAVMVVFSQPCIRRSGCFEVFYWTHLLYVAFWCLLLIHSANFWKWFLVPGLIYLAELCVRITRRNTGRTAIVEGVILPSRVTQLIIRRPEDFRFRPGDYILVKIPLISRHEWHPFTVSSAPEQKDLVSLHVRAVGEWTNNLYEFFVNKKLRERDELFTIEGQKWKFSGIVWDDGNNLSQWQKPFVFRNHGKYVLSSEQQCCKDNWHLLPKSVGSDTCNTIPMKQLVPMIEASPIGDDIEIYIDGPYGTPTSNIFAAKHAVLVAAGIGVTPYASVLQSILLRYWSTHRAFSKCTACSCPLAIADLSAVPGPMKLRKVDFIWINRDLKSLEWFLELLSHLKGELNRNACPILSQFLGIHLYITRRQQQRLTAEDPLDTSDTYLGELKGSINSGRPKWDQVLQRIAYEKRGKVTVFCCGPTHLKRELREKCNRFGFVFKKEAF